MWSFLEDAQTLYILIGCCAVLLITMTTCICVICMRKKKEKRPTPKKQASLEMNGLLFAYERNIERQQSPTRYPASCPVSPLDSDRMRKRSTSQGIAKVKLSDDIFSQRRGSLNPADLDINLYQTEDVLSNSPYAGLGRLSMNLTYDHSSEKLIIHVDKGVKIQAKQINSSPNPYLKVCLLPDKKRRMHSKTKKGEDPTFNEDFIFSVPHQELSKRILRVAVCDFDRFSRQTVLGYVVLCLGDVMDEITSEDGTGVIWKDLTDNDAMPGLKKGELLFSLSYLPTAGRMTIAIAKAKDLNVNEDKETGVAVKINLILNGKVVKSKKTSTCKMSLSDPTFNESFVYEVTSDVLERISFIFIVYAYSNNGKRIIGKANTGPYMYSTGTGLSHWNDMLIQARRAVSHWHKLM